ncbi:nucleotide-binding domain-containing protein [Hortaea werneckii]|nr:nucleotide-binding domain-containing protein [Hortaea werneckii]KAI6863428.1 nucleotide-binding domain-containing protein [Hortaea werneckii]KAI7262560.1 nucleotide-binding domain-containing protein [Hortaea werneckii]KAI7346245.1 nucleotide-binding domain-containing protein [Hortaea werneckii]KAI7553561.1 nucleotide-binding domain-containing protein [Hortaea werneckii]
MDLNPDAKIIIIGAGVFGLSTALHLAKRGYTNIHVFDKQPYDKNGYAYRQGADGASADENKILRASYADRLLYQELAFKAMSEWEEWNRLIASSPPDSLPGDLTPDVKLWNKCGYLRLSDHFEESEKLTQKNFPSEIRHSQYRVTDPQRRADAEKDGIPRSKIDPFGRLERSLPTDGILDMTAGFVLASKSCSFALHLCRQAGVECYLGPDYALQALNRDGKTVTGIKTAGGMERHADLVIVACGGWTPSMIPETERLLETTSGSVLSIRLPIHRQDLWQKYSPEKFPVWDWESSGYVPLQNVGGIYGLPRTPDGVVKMAFRGAKWTNYSKRSDESGRPLSYPVTDLEKVPAEAVRVLRRFCEENMPDLLELDLEHERLCWYTDSVDNSFLIDFVPGTPNLVVASGGSGHGFKFLPVLGERIVDVIEGKDTEYTRLFKWRDVPTGKRNGLEEGPQGWRTLDKQKLAGNRQWRGHESKL